MKTLFFFLTIFTIASPICADVKITGAKIREGYNPATEVSGCVSWHDASDSSTFDNPAAIGTWSDKSGNGYDVIQGTASYKPDAQTKELNNLPVVTFDGNDYLAKTGYSDLDTCTIFVVGTFSSGTQEGMFEISAAAVNTGVSLMYEGGSIKARVDAGGNNAIETLPLPLTHIYEVVVDGSNVELLFDGFSKDIFSVGTLTNTLSDFRVGSLYNLFYLNGDVAEIIVYNRALNTTERDQIRGYLSAKWGLSTFKPTDISNCLAWFDASDDENVDSTGTVSAWYDKSGNNKHATTILSTRRPVYLIDAINGLPVLNFTDDFLGAPINLRYTVEPNATVFVVGKTAATSYSAYWGQGQTSYFDRVLIVATSSSQTRISLGPSTYPVPGTGTVDEVEVITVAMQHNVADGSYVYVNGVEVLNYTEVQSGTSASNLSIGNITPVVDAPASNYHYTGYYAEMIVYNRTLTTIERQQVERYLADKWGVTLKAFDPTVIEDCEVWYDGADVHTIDNTSAIGQWNDKSGNNRHATQSTATDKPSYALDSINGLSTIRFADDYLIAPVNIDSPDMPDVTIFSVTKKTFTDGTDAIYGIDNGGWDRLVLTTYSGGAYVGAGTNVALPGFGTLNEVELLTLSLNNGANSYAYLDGSQIASFTDNSVSSTYTSIGIGNIKPASSSYTFSGNIAELIIYSQILHVEEREIIEEYLKDKWGIN